MCGCGEVGRVHAAFVMVVCSFVNTKANYELQYCWTLWYIEVPMVRVDNPRSDSIVYQSFVLVSYVRGCGTDLCWQLSRFPVFIIYRILPFKTFIATFHTECKHEGHCKFFELNRRNKHPPTDALISKFWLDVLVCSLFLLCFAYSRTTCNKKASYSHCRARQIQGTIEGNIPTEHGRKCHFAVKQRCRHGKHRDPLDKRQKRAFPPGTFSVPVMFARGLLRLRRSKAFFYSCFTPNDGFETHGHAGARLTGQNSTALQKGRLHATRIHLFDPCEMNAEAEGREPANFKTFLYVVFG